jgi:ubiquinone/menaquinone biosynthesis C-methylase UbiE
MTEPQSVAREAVLARLRLGSYDLATRDKIPVIQRLMRGEGPGLALDVGVGTGYTTYSVFGSRPTVCLDVDPANLAHYRDRVASVPGASRPLCVVAEATALPFKSGVFRFVLCSEVLEHLEHDRIAAAEVARVMAPGATGVITVPYTGMGFTSFLELLRIKTVHDFPGPERHVRQGYDERSMTSLMEGSGLKVEKCTYYFRLFSRLIADGVSVAHLLYQRFVHKRRAWKWSDVTTLERAPVVQFYGRLFPVLWFFSRVDRLLQSRRGFGLIVAVRKP